MEQLQEGLYCLPEVPEEEKESQLPTVMTSMTCPFSVSPSSYLNTSLPYYISWNPFPGKLFALQFLFQVFPCGHPNLDTCLSNIPSGEAMCTKAQPVTYTCHRFESGANDNGKFFLTAAMVVATYSFQQTPMIKGVKCLSSVVSTGWCSGWLGSGSSAAL